MSGTITAEFVSTREVKSLDDALRLLAKNKQSILLETTIEGKPSRGILVDHEVYRELLQRLEDLEDLRAMREAETEYRAGEGRPFSEIVAELRAEEEANVSG
jgi:hypothetical protein